MEDDGHTGYRWRQGEGEALPDLHVSECERGGNNIVEWPSRIQLLFEGSLKMKQI